jgi:hypothetical protein
LSPTFIFQNPFQVPPGPAPPPCKDLKLDDGSSVHFSPPIYFFCLPPSQSVGNVDAYGVQNFEDVRIGDVFYADRTQFLREVNPDNRLRSFHFFRPPRFGKSLFLSVIQHYFDVSFKDKE